MIAHNAAISYYGDALVDRQGNWLFILYPELLIRNSSGFAHNIRDLVLRISIDNNKITALAADRFTMTDIEYACHNYIHSHVSGIEWGSFCLGNSDVGDLINESTQGLFTEDHWCLFFLTMENFLQIESDSPYKRITNLNLANINRTNYSPLDERAEYIKFKNLFPNYEFKVSVNSQTHLLSLDLDTQFYKDFALILNDKFKGIYDDSVDKAREARDSSEKLFTGSTKREFRFKGTVFKQQVVPTIQEAKREKDYPLQDVCNKIRHYLKNKVNEKARVKNYKPIPEDRIKDLSEFVRGDMELAQEN